MRQDTKPHEEMSPPAILTELAIEGASSFVEAQRILLHLAQQENEIIMAGVKNQFAGSTRGVAMIDLLRRSLDTLITMHEDFLTTTSKQTLHWLEAVKAGKSYDSTHLTKLAREQMQTFIHAQKKFLELVAQETAKAASGQSDHTAKTVKGTDLPKLAREAADSFIDAQKKLLDVLGQQVNVNLGVATRTMELLSPSRLWPMAKHTGEGVMKSFVEAEKAVVALAGPGKRSKVARTVERRRSDKTHARKTAKILAHA